MKGVPFTHEEPALNARLDRLEPAETSETRYGWGDLVDPPSPTRPDGDGGDPFWTGRSGRRPKDPLKKKSD